MKSTSFSPVQERAEPQIDSSQPQTDDGLQRDASTANDPYRVCFFSPAMCVPIIVSAGDQFVAGTPQPPLVFLVVPSALANVPGVPACRPGSWGTLICSTPYLPGLRIQDTGRPCLAY